MTGDELFFRQSGLSSLLPFSVAQNLHCGDITLRFLWLSRAGSSPVARTISSVHNGFQVWTLDFYILMYEQACKACSFSCALGDILNGHAFAGIGGVVVTGVRDLNDTHEFVMNHNALGKELSGAVLHKTVFAFRLAYIIEIEKALGIKLPIILDSPSGKEVDQANIQLVVDILKRDFSDNQIIIASIFRYDFDEVNTIEIVNRLIE